MAEGRNKKIDRKRQYPANTDLHSIILNCIQITIQQLHC